MSMKSEQNDQNFRTELKVITDKAKERLAKSRAKFGKGIGKGLDHRGGHGDGFQGEWKGLHLLGSEADV